MDNITKYLFFDAVEISKPFECFCYGAGTRGRAFAMCATLFNIKPIAFIDRNPDLQNQTVDSISYGGTYTQIPIISVEEAKNSSNIAVIVTADHAYQIREYLEKQGFNNIYLLPGSRNTPHAFGYRIFDAEAFRIEVNNHKPEIDFVSDFFCDKRSRDVFEAIIDFRLQGSSDITILESIYEGGQYFPYDIVHFVDDGVFIDGGSYDGETAKQFAEKSNGYKYIYSFEPNPRMHSLLLKNKLPRQQIIPKGLSSRFQTVRMSTIGSSAVISKDGDEEIQTIALDDLEMHPATFIKLDIEGFEMEALVGAHKTISRYMPTLAVCVYHKPNDLWELPLYLMKKYDGYSFYLRHHSLGGCETVLYCVPKLGKVL